MHLNLDELPEDAVVNRTIKFSLECDQFLYLSEILEKIYLRRSIYLTGLFPVIRGKTRGESL